MTKDELIEKYRDINVDHFDWWDSTYDLFKEDMEAIGITVDKMHFSGFWSQGDGACFEGGVTDWGLFLTELGYPEDEHIALHHLARNNWSFGVTHRGHHYHENCTAFEYEIPNPDDWYNKEDFILHYCPHADEFKQQAWYAALGNYTYNYESLVEYAEAEFKYRMRELYRRLQDDYEYLVSDEAVWDTIEANELDTDIEEAA